MFLESNRLIYLLHYVHNPREESGAFWNDLHIRIINGPWCLASAYNNILKSPKNIKHPRKILYLASYVNSVLNRPPTKFVIMYYE